MDIHASFGLDAVVRNPLSGGGRWLNPPTSHPRSWLGNRRRTRRIRQNRLRRRWSGSGIQRDGLHVTHRRFDRACRLVALIDKSQVEEGLIPQ
jgi:hypothetical protein